MWSDPITYSWYYWQNGWERHLLWQAGIQEIVFTTESLLLVYIINLLFSSGNLPRLACAICSLCLYLFCNCKITNKVFESFFPNFIGKEQEEWSGETLSCSLRVFELLMRAIKYLRVSEIWFVCHKISNRHPSWWPLLQNMQCKSLLLRCLISLKSDRWKSSVFLQRSTNLSTLVQSDLI